MWDISTPDTGVRVSAESGELKSRFEPGPEISMLEPSQSNSFNDFNLEKVKMLKNPFKKILNFKYIKVSNYFNLN